MIDSLPALPSSLVNLFCGVNQLSSLPSLPASLTRLYCNNNNLTTLPALPAGLSRFYCFGNHLSGLPSLPSSLTWLDCSYNELTTLPVLPDSLYSFDCRVNVGLYCLPQLNKILYFTFDSTGVGCLPDYPQDNVSCTPSLSSISVCGLSNPNGCLTYAGITQLSSTQLNIDPNPASDILTIKINGSEISNSNYSIIDLEGRTILSGTIVQGINTIDITSISEGVYLVHTDLGNTLHKMVKN
jgi:Leucine-rich repeat (LRR) protein